ncbi:trans-sialidase [Trypanosoma rangeli]|uniref:Trans-sialidase n=1 Tax=Trypanosoma rangeli TaxID=5698 RepID=A0A422MTF4_TRYRA|nr:trans-sialidase [Trypanosoma rangeli]RNE96489.1 trans-sialidase [Trypanosoma rangeli]|eukprot:RNE96489.1 trans-sialidase [Trypanosoma rangeli]
MLLTTPVYSEEKKEDNKNGKGRLHLWVTDNARVHDVGPVSSEEHDAAASSLLYRKKSEKEEELVLLYEKKNDGDDSFSLVSVRLTDKLPRIKEVVKTWKEIDAALKSCTSGGTFDPRAKGMCNGPIPTEGLVGFLSNTLTDGTDAGKIWKDEYLGVNATVKNVRQASTAWGVRFKGAAAGAEWPVGSKGQNQPYYFANNEFTLVATVAIHAVPEDGGSPIPLLGAKLKGNDGGTSVLFGLSYTKDNTWSLTSKDGAPTASGSAWKPDEKYNVALVWQGSGQGSVYIDGQPVWSSQPAAPSCAADSCTISHFYISGGGSTGAEEAVSGESSVTVANVLLYNRWLSDTEIGVLHKKAATTSVMRDATPPAGSAPLQDSSSNGVGVAVPAPAPDVVTSKSTAGPRAKSSKADSSVRGCGAAVLLPLLLLGLWGCVSLV